MGDEHALLRCPLCQAGAGSDVVDSRVVSDGTQIRRRRHCHQCGERFTTYEMYRPPAAGLRGEVVAQLRALAKQIEEWHDG